MPKPISLSLVLSLPCTALYKQQKTLYLLLGFQTMLYQSILVDWVLTALQADGKVTISKAPGVWTNWPSPFLHANPSGKFHFFNNEIFCSALIPFSTLQIPRISISLPSLHQESSKNRYLQYVSDISCAGEQMVL